MTNTTYDQNAQNAQNVAPEGRAGAPSAAPVHTGDLADRMAGRSPVATRAAGEQAGGVSGATGPAGTTAPLFEDTERFRTEWSAVQTGFVDEPRRAVERADALVAEVIQQLVSSFAEERSRLEGQWSMGDEASTEDLRLALQRYRSFFDRLLAA